MRDKPEELCATPHAFPAWAVVEAGFEMEPLSPQFPSDQDEQRPC